MLRYLRENSGNWIIKIFLGIIVVVFVFLGVGSMNSSRNNSVASVNDIPITVDEFEYAYRNLVEQMRRRFQDNLTDDLLKALNLKQQALNSLIEDKLMLAQADAFEIAVTDLELQESILAIEAFQRDGQFDMEQYRQMLGLNSLTPEMFEQLQREQLKKQKLQDMVLSTVSVSDLEADSFYAFYNTAVKVDYIKVDPADVSGVTVTPDQIQAHYEKNKDRYQSEPKRRAAFIRYSPKDFQGQVNITPDQVAAYYEANPEEFETPEQVEASHILIQVDDTADEAAVETARKKALAVYQRAVKGEDFAELAKETSQGPSAEDGGYLGKFDRNSMIQPFSDVAFALTPGQISEPVRTQFGWHVIKVTNRFDEQVKPLDQAAEEIKTRLKQEEMQQLAYYKAEDAFDAVIDGDTLEQVALTTEKNIENTDAFDQNGTGLDLDPAFEFAQAAFDLQPRQISDIRQIGNDYFLIEVTETIDPVQLPLEAVADQISGELEEEFRLAEAKTRAQNLLEAVKTAGDIDQTALENGLTVSTSDWFTRNETVQDIGRSDALIRAAFSLTPEQPVHPEVLQTNQGFFIIAYHDRQPPEPDEIQENLTEIKTQLLQTKQGQYFQAWIDELKEKSQIDVTPGFFNE
ncbi:MAG: SurA N-terminal domain-containing protein [Desulfotignum sp.]|nr:SurA N-terminal domain-containing protein [Desulfotignum sp.]